MNSSAAPSNKFVGVSVSPVVIRVVLESGHLDWRARRGVGRIYGSLAGRLGNHPNSFAVRCDINVEPDGITAAFDENATHADRLADEILDGIAAALADPAFGAALNSSHDIAARAEMSDCEHKARCDMDFAHEYTDYSDDDEGTFDMDRIKQDPRYLAVRTKYETIAVDGGWGEAFDAWWARENWLPYTD